MKIKRRYKDMMVAILIGFFFSAGSFPAMAQQVETLVLLKVTEKGFLDEKGHPLKHVLKIPKGSRIKIVFEYADKTGDVHEFGLLFDSGEEIYSNPVSEKNLKTELVFFANAHGERFELYCILGCTAMDKLTDLALVVS